MPLGSRIRVTFHIGVTLTSASGKLSTFSDIRTIQIFVLYVIVAILSVFSPSQVCKGGAQAVFRFCVLTTAFFWPHSSLSPGFLF